MDPALNTWMGQQMGHQQMGMGGMGQQQGMSNGGTGSFASGGIGIDFTNGMSQSNTSAMAMAPPAAGGVPQQIDQMMGQMMGGGAADGFNPRQQQNQTQSSLYFNALQTQQQPRQQQQQNQPQQQQQQLGMAAEGGMSNTNTGGGDMSSVNQHLHQHQLHQQPQGMLAQMQQQAQANSNQCLSRNSGQQQQQPGGGAGATDNQAQLLLQQQNLIAQLQRQLQHQQGGQQQQQQPPNGGIVGQHLQLHQRGLGGIGGQSMSSSNDPVQAQQQQFGQSPSLEPLGGSKQGQQQQIQQQQNGMQQLPLALQTLMQHQNSNSFGMVMPSNGRQDDGMGRQIQLQQQQQQQQQQQLLNISGNDNIPGGQQTQQMNQMNFQGMFGNNGGASTNNRQLTTPDQLSAAGQLLNQTQQQSCTPSVSNDGSTSLLGPVNPLNNQGVSVNGGGPLSTNTVGTPAPTNPSPNARGAGEGVSVKQNPAGQNSNPNQQQILDAMRRATSSTNNSQQPRNAQEQQQILMARMLQQIGGNVNATASGGTGGIDGGTPLGVGAGRIADGSEAKQSVGMEERTKQSQVMQHLQQLQRKLDAGNTNQAGQSRSQRASHAPEQQVLLGNGNNCQTGSTATTAGTVTASLSVNAIKKNEGACNRSSGGLGKPSQRGRSKLLGGRREPHDLLGGVAPDPIADGAIQNSLASQGPVPLVGSRSGPGNGSSRGGGKNVNQSFLDGHFAGGWQSNADLQDRRRIIFSIIKVIERMRPDANQMSQNRLPLMAKKLEEHLYRSAHTREDYIDPASLKRRLHIIAKGVGFPKPDDDDSTDDEGVSRPENQRAVPIEAMSQGPAAGKISGVSAAMPSLSNPNQQMQQQHQILLQSQQQTPRAQQVNTTDQQQQQKSNDQLPAVMEIPQDQSATSGMQEMQQELQKKQLLMQQIQQQKRNLFGQSQELQHQLMDARSPQHLHQLQKQQTILQQLSQQFEQRQLILQGEILQHTCLIQQQQQQQPQPQPQPQHTVRNQLGNIQQQDVTKRGTAGSNSDSLGLISTSGSEGNTHTFDPASITNKAKRSLNLIATAEGQQTEGDHVLRPHKIPKPGSGNSASSSIPAGGKTPTSSDRTAASAAIKGADSFSTLPSLTPTDAATPSPTTIEKQIATKCLPLAKKLLRHKHGWVFKDPIDPIELDIPEYFDVVEQPMDLTLVVNKLEEGAYTDVAGFVSDTKLVFENAISFNGEDSDVGNMAKEMLEIFNKDIKKMT